MSIRSADATIKGYFYQFNRTIEELFSLQKDAETATVEGIEDIDINSINGMQAVQCKYYSSHVLTNSTVREPITLMLDHFIDPSSKAIDKYTLYGYFKNELPGLTKTYSIDELKSILTYKENKIEHKYHVDKGVADASLTGFLQKFQLLTGKEFEEQRGDCIKLIKRTLNCTDFEANNYYYNNAVRVVFDLAIQKQEQNRRISKKEFLNRICCSKVLYLSWLKKFRSHKAYATIIKKAIIENNLFSPGKQKLLFLGKGVDLNTPEMPLHSFIESIANKYFMPGSAKYTSKPVTIVIDTDRHSFLEMKRKLVKSKILFNDGLEEILFDPEHFCSEPIMNKLACGKISKASFTVRIISKATFDAHVKSISLGFSLLYVSEDEFDFAGLNINQLIEAKYFESLAEINSIL